MTQEQQTYSDLDFSENESTDGDNTTENEEIDDEIISLQRGNSEYRKSPTHQGKRMQRRPTRKPDPNTFNRNAIMARENRRKKKEYIETLEKEVHTYRVLNKQLHKIIKKQQKNIGTLREEKKYFQSVIRNKTKICSLINAVQGIVHSNPLQRKGNESKKNCRHLDSDLHKGQPESLKTTSKQANLNEVFHIKGIPESNDYHSYLNNVRVDEFSDSWENALETGSSPFSGESLFENLDFRSYSANQGRIDDEHNYYDNRLEDDTSELAEVNEDAGVCIHVSGGKISLEMCPSCHKSSTQQTAGFIS